MTFIAAIRKWKFMRFSKTCTPREVLRCIATLDDESCRLVESDLRRRPETFGFLYVQDVLCVARELPGDHPGWSILALLVEHTVGYVLPYKIGDLGRLGRRMEAGEFAEMLPFAVIVWLECRVRAHMPANEHTTFSPEWREIMLQAVESSAILQTNAKSLLPGKIAMAFSEISSTHLVVG
jgi:hypothetical protein